MKLYVKNTVKEPKDNLYKFLYKVLRLDGPYHIQSTVNSTFYNSEHTKLQCVNGKNRSFDDLVLISKTYFRVSDKAIAKVIKRILDENNSLGLLLCDSVNKWILNRHLNNSETIKYCFRYNNSHLKTDNSGDGVYSFDDIITLMGLTKEDVKIN